MASLRARLSIRSSMFQTGATCLPARAARSLASATGCCWACDQYAAGPGAKRHRAKRPVGATGSVGAFRFSCKYCAALSALLRGDGDWHREDLRLWNTGGERVFEQAALRMAIKLRKKPSSHCCSLATCTTTRDRMELSSHPSPIEFLVRWTTRSRHITWIK